MLPIRSFSGVLVRRILPALLPAVIAAAALPGAALAAGTAAGTSISNTVSIDYEVGGVAQTTVQGNTSFVVDDKVDLTVANGAGTTVVPGATDQVLTFTVTNTGNATHGYALSVASAGGTMTTTNVRLYYDSNDNGTFESGTDTLYTSGSGNNVADVAADGTIRIFVVVDVPAAAANGNTETFTLTATTLDQGTNTATTEDNGADNTATVEVVFADAAGATDAAEDGKHSAQGTFTVSSATLTATKTVQVVSDPYNNTTNPKAIPGATVRYTITVTNNGGADAENVVLADAIPANTTYAAGSLKLDGGALTDADDADEGDYNITAAGAVTVAIGTIASGGGSAEVTFDVTVN